jgi:hypothetical protein
LRKKKNPDKQVKRTAEAGEKPCPPGAIQKRSSVKMEKLPLAKNFQRKIILPLQASAGIKSLVARIKQRQLKIYFSPGTQAEQDPSYQALRQLGLPLMRTNPYAQITQARQAMGSTDFVILGLSPAYLKDLHCMQEALALLKDEKWRQQIIPVILPGMDLSWEKEIEYLQYWQDEHHRLTEGSLAVQGLSVKPNFAQAANTYQNIVNNLGDFLNLVRNIQPVSWRDLQASCYEPILRRILDK